MARGVRPTPPARERRAAVLAAGRSAALELDAGELLELLEPLELELDAGELLELLEPLELELDAGELLEPLELELDAGELLELLELLELFEPLELELDAGELLELLELAGCALPCARVSARSAAVLLDAGRASAAATGVDRVDAHRYALHDQGLSAMHRHEWRSGMRHHGQAGVSAHDGRRRARDGGRASGTAHVRGALVGSRARASAASGDRSTRPCAGRGCLPARRLGERLG